MHPSTDLVFSSWFEWIPFWPRQGEEEDDSFSSPQLSSSSTSSTHNQIARLAFVPLVPLGTLYLLLVSLNLGHYYDDFDNSNNTMHNQNPSMITTACSNKQASIVVMESSPSRPTHPWTTLSHHDPKPMITGKNEKNCNDSSTSPYAIHGMLDQNLWSAWFVASSPHSWVSSAAKDDIVTTPSQQMQESHAILSSLSPIEWAARSIPISETSRVPRLSVVLPWIFTLVFGVLVPASLSVRNLMFRQHQQTRNNDMGHWSHSIFFFWHNDGLYKDVRWKPYQIQQKLQAHSRILQKEDQWDENIGDETKAQQQQQQQTKGGKETTKESKFVSFDDGENVANRANDEELPRSWRIPCHTMNKTGQPRSFSSTTETGLSNWFTSQIFRFDTAASQQQNMVDSKTNRDPSKTSSSTRSDSTTTQLRTIPGTCAICLFPFEVRDRVCWSSNADCVHVFHASCMASWLTRRPVQRDCPCCRRTYVS